MKLGGASLNCRWLSAVRSACGQEEQEREDGEMHGASGFVRPNVEVTGARRYGTLAARRNMDNERFAARVPCRSASG